MPRHSVGLPGCRKGAPTLRSRCLVGSLGRPPARRPHLVRLAQPYTKQMSTNAWAAARASAAAVRGAAAGIVAMPPEPCTALPGPLQGCSAAGCVRAKRGNALARPAARPFGQPRIRLHGGAQGQNSDLGRLPRISGGEMSPQGPAAGRPSAWRHAGGWGTPAPLAVGWASRLRACALPSSSQPAPQALQLSEPCQLLLPTEKSQTSNARGPAAARLCRCTTARLRPRPPRSHYSHYLVLQWVKRLHGAGGIHRAHASRDVAKEA